MARPLSPFRVTVLAVYLGGAALFIALLGRGIVTSIIDEMGWSGGRPQACGSETPDTCAQRLVSLRRALDVKLSELQRAGGGGARLWDEWAVVWRRELTQVEGQCCLGQPEVPAGFQRLVKADRDLRELQALYTTHVVQYAREIGGKAEAVDRELGLDAEGPGPAAPTQPAR